MFPLFASNCVSTCVFVYSLVLTQHRSTNSRWHCQGLKLQSTVFHFRRMAGFSPVAVCTSLISNAWTNAFKVTTKHWGSGMLVKENFSSQFKIDLNDGAKSLAWNGSLDFHRIMAPTLISTGCLPVWNSLFQVFVMKTIILLLNTFAP